MVIGNTSLDGLRFDCLCRLPGMLDDLVLRLAWVVVAGLDCACGAVSRSKLGCVFGHTADRGQNQRGEELPWRPNKLDEKMADHDVSARVLISVREAEVL